METNKPTEQQEPIPCPECGATDWDLVECGFFHWLTPGRHYGICHCGAEWDINN